MIKTPWENAPDSIDGLAGFVYKIVNKRTSQAYIGKKFFWSIRYRKLKGRARRKRYEQESNWRYYRSSSKEVHEEIKKHGLKNFHFIILECFSTRAEVNYRELELQIEHDVLRAKLPDGNWAYYNKNILRQFYKKRS